MKISISIKNLEIYFMGMMCMLSCILLTYIQNTLYKIGMILLCVLIIMGIYRKGKKIKIHAISIGWGLFTIWSGLSLFWSKPIKQTSEFIVICFEFVVILCLSNYLDTENKICIFMKSSIVCSVILLIYLVVYSGIDNLLSKRIESTIINSNTAGIIFAIAILMSLFIYMREKKKKYLCAITFFGLMVLLSGSRTAILDVVLEIMIFSFVVSKKSVKDRIKQIIVILLFLIVIYFFCMEVDVFYNIIGSRIENTIQIFWGNKETVSHESTNIRMQMILFGIQKFIENPFWGYGIANYANLSVYRTYAHSNFIELIVDVGIIGVTFFYAVYFLIIYKLKKNRKIDIYWKAYIVSFCTIILLNNFLSVYYHIMSFQIFICLVYAYLFNITE